VSILGWLSSRFKSTYNLVMKIKKTVNAFKIVYKDIWNAEYKKTHDTYQQIENILQTKVDSEHQNTFSYVRNRLIMDKDLTWEQSAEVARDIFKKDLDELDDYEREVRGEYHVD